MYSENPSQGYPTCPPFVSPGREHAASGTSPQPGKWGIPEKRFQMLFRNAYFRSLVHSSQKLWPKPDQWFPELNEGAIFEKNSCSNNDLSKCNIKLPCIFGNSKKMFFMNRSNRDFIEMEHRYWEKDKKQKNRNTIRQKMITRTQKKSRRPLMTY